jgi:hypothetical protein
MLFKNILMLATAFFSWVYTPKKGSKGIEPPLARVYDKYLYASELKGADQEADNKLNDFIDSWASRLIVIEEAKKSSVYKKFKIDKKIQDYRDELIYHTFMQMEVNKRLNKLKISDQEISDYYTKHEGSFRTSNTLVFVKAIKCRQELPNSIIAKFNSININDQEAVSTYVKNKEDCYFLRNNEWMSLDELIKETDNNLYNNLPINRNRLLVVRNAGYIYYINIKDYKLVGQIAPLEFVKDKVVHFLITIKRNELQKKIEAELIKKAINNGEYSVYKK